MYYLNKIVGGLLNPLGMGMLMVILGLGLAVVGKWSRLAKVLLALSVVWLWFWSTGAAGRLIGLPLERAFPPQLAEEMPTADAIVVLGGGIGENTNACPYAELFSGADRAWHGARLYKAGKAPRVFVTNGGDARFMADLGVPKEAIAGPSEARNTEEEARFIAEAMKQVKVRGEGEQWKVKILLVTSAWHMRRAKMMFDKYATGVEVVPAAADHEATTLCDKPLEFKDFVLDSGALMFNAYMFKEWVAYWGYKWLRR